MEVHILFTLCFKFWRYFSSIFFSYNIITRSCSSYSFTSAFTSTDVIFHNLLELHSKLSEKRFIHECSYSWMFLLLTDSLNNPPPHNKFLVCSPMQKWNVPTDRVQIAGEKNKFICLVIIFTQEDLSVALKRFAQAVTNFLLLSAENTKKSHVLHFNNHNPGNKHNFYHFLDILTTFFSSTLCALSFGLSHLCIPRTSKFLHFKGPPFASCSGL